MIPTGTRRTYLSALPRRKGLELVLQRRARLPGADAAALHQGCPVAPAQLLQSMGDPEGGDRCLLPVAELVNQADDLLLCLLYTSPSPRDLSTSRMPSSA